MIVEITGRRKVRNEMLHIRNLTLHFHKRNEIKHDTLHERCNSQERDDI